MIVWCLSLAPADFFYSYKYNTVIQAFQNDTVNIGACVDPLTAEDAPQIQVEPSVGDSAGKTNLRRTLVLMLCSLHLKMLMQIPRDMRK